MGGFYKICNKDNTEEEIGEIWSNKQQWNTPKSVEAIALLNLIKNIEKNTKIIHKELITIFSDNIKIVNEVNSSMEKVTQGV